MRGILYRTDDEGNVLDKPEIKISALKGSNIKVYENQEAKQAALANGDIKPGDVVLSGGEQYGSGCNPIWSEAIQNIDIVNYKCPSDGFLLYEASLAEVSASTKLQFYINEVLFGYCSKHTATDLWYTNANNMLIVNKDDEITISYNATTYQFSTDSFFTFVPRR